jgi:hypothetical protein
MANTAQTPSSRYPEWFDDDIRKSLETVNFLQSNKSPKSSTFNASHRTLSTSSNPFDRTGSYSEILSKLVADVKKEKAVAKKKNQYIASRSSQGKLHEQVAALAASTNNKPIEESKEQPENDDESTAPAANTNILSSSNRLGRSPSPSKNVVKHTPGSLYCIKLGLHDHTPEQLAGLDNGMNLKFFDKLEKQLRELAQQIQNDRQLQTTANQLNTSSVTSNTLNYELELKYILALQKLSDEMKHKDAEIDQREELLISSTQQQRERDRKYMENIQRTESEIREKLFSEQEEQRKLLLKSAEQDKQLYEKLLQQQKDLNAEISQQNKRLREELSAVNSSTGTQTEFVKSLYSKQISQLTIEKDNIISEFNQIKSTYIKQIDNLTGNNDNLNNINNRIRVDLEQKIDLINDLTIQNNNLKSKVKDFQHQLLQSQQNETKLLRLKAELGESEARFERRENDYKEERLLMEMQIDKLMNQIKEWESREERRNKMNAQRQLLAANRRYLFNQVEQMNPLNSGAQSAHCAWASGPIDRNTLQY